MDGDLGGAAGGGEGRAALGSLRPGVFGSGGQGGLKEGHKPSRQQRIVRGNDEPLLMQSSRGARGHDAIGEGAGDDPAMTQYRGTMQIKGLGASMRFDGQPRRPRNSERCSRCTKDVLWMVYDVYAAMLRKGRESVSRSDYIASLKEFPTVEKLRVIRHSNIEARFRKSSDPVTLHEFLRMVWPSASDDEIKLMERWGQLREAQRVLRDRNFRADEAEMKRIFTLLDDNDDRTLTVGELYRSNILTPKEIKSILRVDGLDKRVTFDEFRSACQPHLKAMYVESAEKPAAWGPSTHSEPPRRPEPVEDPYNRTYRTAVKDVLRATTTDRVTSHWS